MAEDVSVEAWKAIAEKSAELEAAAEKDMGDEGEDGFNIGIRDGFSLAIQMVDQMTGGDGEYRYCLGVQSERHCPDPGYMARNIYARTLSRPLDREALIELIREKLMSSDYPVSQFEQEFADAILELMRRG